jgi:fused signal recognition particle receptor
VSEQPEKRSLFGRLFGRGGGKPQSDEPQPVEPEAIDLALVPVPALEPALEKLPETVHAPMPDGTVIADTASPAPETAGDRVPAGEAAPLAAKRSWYQRLTEGLKKTSSKLTEGITSVFTKRKLDAATLEELEDLLIQADLGVETATRITEALTKGRYDKSIDPEEVKAILSEEVAKVLAPVASPLRILPQHKPHVVLVVGVNGSGKTTTIGKYAKQLTGEGRRVMLAAGDTFRAAAIDQLKIWGERTGVPVVARDVGADSSGLAFDALKTAREGGYDVLLMDTAGRLQNKQALMDELEKVIRVMRKIDPTAPHDVVLVLDATTGQNALSQVEVFRERAGVTGLVMTKLDGTARGGILVAIAARFGLPVHAIGVGEGIDDLQAFDAGEFARAIATG